MVQYKAFWFLVFEDDFWNASSVTVHVRLDTILEACSHFAQRFRGNRLNFLPNGVLQIINLSVAYRKHLSFQKPPEMSRDIVCFRADNLGFPRTASLTWLILSGVLAHNDRLPDWSQFCYGFWSSPPTLNSICDHVKMGTKRRLSFNDHKKFWWDARRKKGPCFAFQLMLPEKPLIRGNADYHSN